MMWGFQYSKNSTNHGKIKSATENEHNKSSRDPGVTKKGDVMSIRQTIVENTSIVVKCGVQSCICPFLGNFIS